MDTLVYKFENLVEHNNRPSDKKITSITFKTSICFGTCPAFTIILLNNENAILAAEEYVKQAGIFGAIISKEKKERIFNLVNYIDVKKLDDRYAVNWTDDRTATLTVNFEDHSVKTISDYGERGTFGLKAVYQEFFDLYENENWVKDIKH